MPPPAPPTPPAPPPVVATVVAMPYATAKPPLPTPEVLEVVVVGPVVSDPVLGEPVDAEALPLFEVVTVPPHAPAPAAAAVRPRSIAAAVRGTVPSLRRSASPQLGHVVSESFAWQPQRGQGIKPGHGERIAPAARPAQGGSAPCAS